MANTPVKHRGAAYVIADDDNCEYGRARGEKGRVRRTRAGVHDWACMGGVKVSGELGRGKP